MCQRFGTLCLFLLHRQVGVEWLGLRNVGVFVLEKAWLENSVSQNFSHMNIREFLKPSHSTPTCLWRWNRQRVPKRRHIKFRRRGITQKKAYTYNILWSVDDKTGCCCIIEARFLLGTTVVPCWIQPVCNSNKKFVISPTKNNSKFYPHLLWHCLLDTGLAIEGPQTLCCVGIGYGLTAS